MLIRNPALYFLFYNPFYFFLVLYDVPLEGVGIAAVLLVISSLWPTRTMLIIFQKPNIHSQSCCLFVHFPLFHTFSLRLWPFNGINEEMKTLERAGTNVGG